MICFVSHSISLSISLILFSNVLLCPFGLSFLLSSSLLLAFLSSLSSFHSCFAAEEVRHLKKRVDALEASGGSASASASRYSSSSAINIIDPLESAYIEKSAAGTTLTRSSNGINGVAVGPGEGVGTGLGQDSAALYRTIQQLVRAELQSDGVKGAKL